jgi:hypothetical protein
VREEAASGEDFRLVWAPRFPLEIFHFPIRSLAQYRLRVDVLLANPAFANPDMLGRLNVARERDNLEQFYAELLPDEAQIEREVAAGDLVRDERVKEFMAGIADEFGGGPRPVVAAGAKELEAERAALEVDAMHVLARTERMLMIRNDHRNRLRRATRVRPKRRPLRRRLRMLVGRLLGRTPPPADAEEADADGEAEGGEPDA